MANSNSERLSPAYIKRLRAAGIDPDDYLYLVDPRPGTNDEAVELQRLARLEREGGNPRFQTAAKK